MEHYISFDVGTVNLGVAAASVTKSDGQAILDWLDTADISASCADRCMSKLWTYLDDMMDLLRWEKYTVMIERQPSKVCSLMRSVELGIRHYFLMRAHRMSEERVTVKSVSPKRKLSSPVIYAAGASSGQKYKARKNAGLAEAIAAFSRLPEVVTFLQTGKGDDAADASLYLVHFGGARTFVGMADDALKHARIRAAGKAAAVAEKVAKRDAAAQEKLDERSARATARVERREAAVRDKEEARAVRAREKDEARAVKARGKDGTRAVKAREKDEARRNGVSAVTDDTVADDTVADDTVADDTVTDEAGTLIPEQPSP